jgi:hypothetical protein
MKTNINRVWLAVVLVAAGLLTQTAFAQNGTRPYPNQGQGYNYPNQNYPNQGQGYNYPNQNCPSPNYPNQGGYGYPNQNYPNQGGYGYNQNSRQPQVIVVPPPVIVQRPYRHWHDRGRDFDRDRRWGRGGRW